MERLLISMVFFGLFPATLPGQSFPLDTLQHTGPDEERITLVILPDGYQAGELSQFLLDAGQIAKDLFNTSPFREYQNFFNLYAIRVPSEESGADHPGSAYDVSEPVFPVTNVKNYFGSTFDYFGIHRLVVPTQSASVFSVLGASFPAYDQALVLTNSPHYGGSGGVFATTTLHPSASEIAIHELGHSFGKLADEYWAGAVYAAEKANMTQVTDPGKVRWRNWLEEAGVGIYQHSGQSWYRPHQSCKMRYLGYPFCAVCTEALLDRIYELVDPIVAYQPMISEQEFTGGPLTFSLDLTHSQPNTLHVEWLLNGNPVTADTDQFTLNGQGLQEGTNTLQAIVTDATPLSRSYLPAAGYQFSHSWTIHYEPVNVCEPGGHFSGKGLEPETVISGGYHYTGSASLANFHIAADSTVLLTAETALSLLPPFRVESGANFSAKIAACAPAVPSISRSVTGIPSSTPVKQKHSAPQLSIAPNPAHSHASCWLDLPRFTEVTLQLFDLSGRLRRTILTPSTLPAGHHRYPVDLSNLPTGMYIIRLKTGTATLSRRLMVSR